MKLISFVATLVALCLILSSCKGMTKEEETVATIPIHVGENTTEITEEALEPTETTDTPSVPNLTTSDKVEFEESAKSGHLARGRLVHTIKSVRIITNAKDIPTTGGFDDYRPACTYDENGNETVWHYPEFVKNNGDFVEHVRLVILDIVVTSDNAENWTINDLDENGNPKGHYADPYVFRIDGKYSLSDTTAAKHNRFWTPDFFSALNYAEEHPFAYRLLPGESVSFSVGFLVGNDYDGSKIPISTLFIRIPFGLLGSDYYRQTFIAISE